MSVYKSCNQRCLQYYKGRIKQMITVYHLSGLGRREGGDIFFQNLSVDLKCVMLILFFDMWKLQCSKWKRNGRKRPKMWDVQCLAHFLWPELLLAKWANCTLHVRLPDTQAWNDFYFKFGWNLGKGYFSTVVQITSRFDHCCVCWLRRNFCQYIKWRHFPLSTNQGKDDTLFPKCCLGAWEISYGKNLLLLPCMMSWYYHICFIFAFLGDNKRGKKWVSKG